MDLSTLKPAAGARKMPKRVGRGIGSGSGKTCGRGTKGTGARVGKTRKWGFEGGQMPLQRRLPKRGFTNVFRKEFAQVNVKELTRFPAGTVVDFDVLVHAGLAPKSADGVKILGQGDLNIPLTVRVHACSQSARDKILGAGGQVATTGGR